MPSTLWDSVFTLPADEQVLAGMRQRGVDPEMTLVLLDRYRRKAVDISNDPSLCVDLVDEKEGAGYAYAKHRLDLFANATSDTPELDWLDLLEGEFWHELAHALYSQELIWYGAHRTGVSLEAENLLEDIRIERRLLEEHFDAKPWLRGNVIGRWYREETIREKSHPSEHGWVRIATILCARRYSNVVNNDEADRLERIFTSFPEVSGADFAAVEDIWKRYASLGDRETSEPLADELIGELADLFEP
jgi:hypothetical protein